MHDVDCWILNKCIFFVADNLSGAMVLGCSQLEREPVVAYLVRRKGERIKLRKRLWKFGCYIW